jgi:hypothetical protein
MGRIQTRVFLILVIGGLWTLVAVWFTPTETGSSVWGVLQIDVLNLVIITVLGVVLWEPLYHLLQQFRWEKDWPAFFGLLTGVNEGVLAWIVLRWIEPMPEGVVVGLSGFLVLFVTTWVVTWVWVNGPMRIFSIRWRFRGGRLW